MVNKCFNHPQNDAVGTCHYCGRFLCSHCLRRGDGYYYCKNEFECLAFQEKERGTSGLTLETEIVEQEIVRKEAVKTVSMKTTDRSEQADDRAAMQKRESYYLKLLRTPRSLRDAIVMAEILTRPGFRRR
jgi:hypothetical protein